MELLILFALVLANGLLAGAEIAILTATKGTVQQRAAEHDHRALAVVSLRKQPERFLATVQIGVTFMGTLAGVLGGYLAKLYVEPLVERSAFGYWVAAPVAATLIAIVGGVLVFRDSIGTGAVAIAGRTALTRGRPLGGEAIDQRQGGSSPGGNR